jgi:hypothetical protein
MSPQECPNALKRSGNESTIALAKPTAWTHLSAETRELTAVRQQPVLTANGLRVDFPAGPCRHWSEVLKPSDAKKVVSEWLAAEAAPKS